MAAVLDVDVSLVAMHDMRKSLITSWEAFEMAQDSLYAFLEEDKHLDIQFDAYLAVLARQEALDMILKEEIATKQDGRERCSGCGAGCSKRGAGCSAKPGAVHWH